ncbi:unnamed protein product [Musa hybrid cultivar]
MYDDLLSASNLRHRDLSFNSLSGPIPRSYEGPSSCLTSMYLTNNKLNGRIPGWILNSDQNLSAMSDLKLLSCISKGYNHVMNSLSAVMFSYISFLGSPAPGACQGNMQHSLYRSDLTGFHFYRIKSCLRRILPCSGEIFLPDFILLVNCGGGKVIMDGNEYEDDRYIRIGCKHKMYDIEKNFISGLKSNNIRSDL